MDTDELPTVRPLVEELSSNIDDLEESLAPLLKNALSESTGKLPLLDRAKLYVLSTYAIESILFSALRLNGVDAKKHDVFQQLSRVKEYFEKIKKVETSGAKRSTTLDKEAASRFIKHGLAGNEKYDHDRAVREAKEKAGAKRKLEDMSVGTHTRFDHAAKRIKAAEEGEYGTQVLSQDTTPGVASLEASAATTDAEPAESEAGVQTISKKQAKRARQRQRKADKRMEEMGTAGPSSVSLEEDSEAALVPSSGIDEAEQSEDAYTSPRAAHASSEGVNTSVHQSMPKAVGQASKKKKKKKRKWEKLEGERADEMK